MCIHLIRMKVQCAIDINKNKEHNAMKNSTIIGFTVGVLLYLIVRYFFKVPHIVSLLISGIALILSMVFNLCIKK